MSTVNGIDFDSVLEENNDEKILAATLDQNSATGFQSSYFALAEELLMEIKQRLEEEKKRRSQGQKKKFIFVLTYTSNLVSSGLRESFKALAEHEIIDAAVATAGGVEEDVIKSLGKTLVGDFSLSGTNLRSKGMNRVGNLLIPNDNYVKFENFFTPVLRGSLVVQQLARHERVTTFHRSSPAPPQDPIERENFFKALQKQAVLEDQIQATVIKTLQEDEEDDATPKKTSVSPNKFIYALGKATTCLGTDGAKTSFVAACAEKRIPIFCPALTDGSMGDMIFFFNFTIKGLVIDSLGDLRDFNSFLSGNNDAEEEPVDVACLALGAGLPKHFLLKAIRNCSPNVRLTHFVSVGTAGVPHATASLGCSGDGSLASVATPTDLSVSGLSNSSFRWAAVYADATLCAPWLIEKVFFQQPQ